VVRVGSADHDASPQLKVEVVLTVADRQVRARVWAHRPCETGDPVLLVRFDDLVAAAQVERVAATYKLSKAERAVVLLLLRGHSNARIGEQLFISRETVRTHLKRIFAKMGVHSRVHALLKVRELDHD
jgi:DNA-binding CsgD family transcriptional regulator